MYRVQLDGDRILFEGVTPYLPSAGDLVGIGGKLYRVTGRTWYAQREESSFDSRFVQVVVHVLEGP